MTGASVADPASRSRAWQAHALWFAVLVSFAAGSVPLIAVHAVPLTAEFAIFVVLVGYTAVGMRRSFAWAWTPWLAAIVALDDLRGIQADGPAAHAGDVARFEGWLFAGHQPVIELQHRWAAAPGTLRAHDVVLSAVYLMHSPAPLLCGAALWLWRRELFVPYVATLLTVAAAGLVTYIAFPESPPWLAAEHGVIPAVRRIVTEVMSHAGPLSSVYAGADPLPNAAMPSLHVSYPIIVTWWTIAAFGRRAWWVAAYPACICVGVVYLGEHWVIDVVAGIAYAAGGIAVGRKLAPPLALRGRGLAPAQDDGGSVC
jgi:hypothetical protein